VTLLMLFTDEKWLNRMTEALSWASANHGVRWLRTDPLDINPAGPAEGQCHLANVWDWRTKGCSAGLQVPRVTYGGHITVPEIFIGMFFEQGKEKPWRQCRGVCLNSNEKHWLLLSLLQINQK
jgi:hypothetical protein